MISFSYISDAEVCFQRYLVYEDGVCKGMSRVLAATAEECCDNRGSKGFATSRVSNGERVCMVNS